MLATSRMPDTEIKKMDAVDDAVSNNCQWPYAAATTHWWGHPA
jgi:hypothetical protein